MFTIINEDTGTEIVYGSTAAYAWRAFFMLGWIKGNFICVEIS